MAKLYSVEELAFIKDAFTLMPIADVTAAFNERFDRVVTYSQIKSATKNHGFKSGRTGRFVKGQESWNKGKKGIHSGSHTSFKKGSRPHNTAPVGTESKTTGDHYIKVKVAEPNVWRFKHILEWEAYNGPVPKGKIVVFKNGDRDNCDISNLQLIDRGVLLQYNLKQGGSYPPELRTTIRAVAEIKVTASRRQRGVSERSC